MKPHIAAALITSKTVHRNLGNILGIIYKIIYDEFGDIKKFLKCLDLSKLTITANPVCTNPPLLIEPYIYYEGNQRKAKLPNLSEALYILEKSVTIVGDKNMLRTIKKTIDNLNNLPQLIEDYIKILQNNEENEKLVEEIIGKLTRIFINLRLIYISLQYLLFVPVSQSILDACWENQLPPSC